MAIEIKPSTPELLITEWEYLSRAILQRDGFRCRWCGANGRGVVMACDHIMPRKLGGPDSPYNLQCLCRDCAFCHRKLTDCPTPLHYVLPPVDGWLCAECYVKAKRAGAQGACGWCGKTLVPPVTGAWYILGLEAYVCNDCQQTAQATYDPRLSPVEEPVARKIGIPAGFDFRVNAASLVDWNEEVAFDKLVEGLEEI